MPHTSVLMVFVDGLGMGSADPAVNPLADRIRFPLLSRMCLHEAVPVDACLGVPGTPQSATGQTALLTGVNAPALLGHHREGFPDAVLRRLISRENIFLKLSRAGLSGTFANAYRNTEYGEMRRRSVTTVAARDAAGGFRSLDDLRAGAAVYQDITGRQLVEAGYDVSVCEPGRAGHNLAVLAARYRFTLFEYFQTDRAAHRGGFDVMLQVLTTLERFLAGVMDAYDPATTLFLLTSDHGNIEEPGVPGHTCNPVPLFAAGRGAREARACIRSLTDVTPFVLDIVGTGENLFD